MIRKDQQSKQLQIWQPKQCSVQGRDPQIHCTSKAGNCKYCKVTKALIRAHGNLRELPVPDLACLEHLSRRPLDTILSQD